MWAWVRLQALEWVETFPTQLVAVLLEAIPSAGSHTALVKPAEVLIDDDQEMDFDDPLVDTSLILVGVTAEEMLLTVRPRVAMDCKPPLSLVETVEHDTMTPVVAEVIMLLATSEHMQTNRNL